MRTTNRLEYVGLVLFGIGLVGVAVGEQSIRDALEPPDHFQSTEALPTFTSEQIDKIVRDVLDEIRFDLEPTEP